MLPKKPPFFIVGCERSGTTLLMVYLDSHPDLVVPPESHVFHRFYRFLPGFGDLKEEKNLRRLVKEILNDVWIERWELNLTVDDFLETLEEKSFRGCVFNLFNQYAASKNKLYWGEKTPVHVMHIKKIIAIFPNAKFIHVVRDGRDVSQSLKNVWFGPETPIYLAEHWQNRIQAFHRAKQLLPKEQFLEIKFEDFILNQNKEFKKITDFLGVNSLEIQEKIPETDLQKYMSRPDGTHYRLKGGIQKNRIGIYKDFFNSKEIGIMESVIGENLKKYGYALNNPGEFKISRFENLLWKIREWIHVKRFSFINTRFFLKGLWQIRFRKWMGLFRRMKWKHCGK